MPSPFVLSIETETGKSHQYGFHLGTDERLARQIAEIKYHDRVQHGMPTVTVALIRDGKLFDCYLGDVWSSNL